MELKTELSSEILSVLDQSVVYAVDYDLSPVSSKRVEGKLVVTATHLLTFEDNQQILSVSLADLSETGCVKLMGSGCFQLKLKNEEQVIAAAFNMSLFFNFTALTQALDYYLDEKKFPKNLEIERRICPKCGYPLMYGSNLCVKCARKPNVLLRLFQIGKKYLFKIVITIVLVMLTELLFIYLPYLNRVLIDDYIMPNNSDIRGILSLMAVTFIAYAFILIFEWVVGYLKNFMAAAISRDLREMMFEKIQKLSLTNITKRSSGDMMARIQNDTARVREFLVNYGADIIIRVFSLTVLSVVLFVTDWKLTLMVAIPIPFILWSTKWSSRVIHRKFEKTWHKGERVNSILHDTINGIRVVKSFGNEKNERDKFERVSTQYCEQLSNAEKFWTLVAPLTGFVMTLGQFLITYFAAEMVLHQTMKIGEMTQYVGYVGMLYAPLNWLIYLPRQLKQASVSTNKMFEILDEPEEGERTQADETVDLCGDIVFDNVSFGYKEYNPVLKKLNFSVKQGEMIGIVGPSGVGKSTLINLLMRLYEPNRGKILINGTPLSDIPRQALRSQIGVVLQETFLFDGSIIDNIRYAKPDSSFEEIVSAAKIAGAHEFILKLPNAYHTRVGDRGYMLSGGERQRIAIARAILHHPKILILDEATSALDTKTEKQIQDTLNGLIKGKTTFAIAHRLSTLRQADKLLVLDKGTIAEFGTHTELLKNKSVYYNLVMAQRQTAKIKK